MLLNSLKFYSPNTVVEAAKLYSTLEEVRLLAGGTFLLNSLKLLKKKGNKTPKHVISLRKIPELKGVSFTGEELTIKAMTIINDLFSSPVLKDNFSVLRTVCRNISTNPIRNMATVGGNLTCRYTWTELGAVMIALDAQMHFLGPDGKEEIISAEEFFKNSAKTNKIFTHVTIRRDQTASLAYRRVKKSSNVDIPLLAVCVKTHFRGDRFSNTRVTVNNGVAFAQRDLMLENFLNESSCQNGVGEDFIHHLDTNLYDTRSDDYKKAMFRVSLKSALRELVDKQKTIQKATSP
jgi:CO/xanthine dehydrogenase FAD-binding subunit